MHDKQVLSLAQKINELKKKSSRPRYPKNIWDQIDQLRPYFRTGELAKRLGISANHLYRRPSARTPKGGKLKFPSGPTLVLIAQIPTIQSKEVSHPILEMELPSGAKIRIFT